MNDNTTTLTFQFSDEDLKERDTKLQCLLKSQDLALALHEIRQRIFRPARKHGYPDPKIQRLVNTIDGHLPDDLVVDSPSAGALVGLLEEEFDHILEEYGIRLDELTY